MVYDLKGLADIETDDEEFGKLLVQNYKGRLRDEQCRVTKNPDESRRYEFLHLSTIYAVKFLEEFGDGRSFTMRKSMNGVALIDMTTRIVPLNTAN